MRVFFATGLLFLSTLLVAQTGKLTLHGRVENQQNLVSYTTLEVYRNNQLFYQGTTLKNGSFKLDLELGHVYNIAFSKEGFVKKSVGVIAKTDSTISGRYFFQIDIELFKIDQDEVDETVLPPVAKLYIIDEKKGFNYDKSYVKWIAGEYKDLE